MLDSAGIPFGTGESVLSDSPSISSSNSSSCSKTSNDSSFPSSATPASSTMTPPTLKIPDLRAQPLVDIVFEDIEDEGLRKNIRHLKEMLPELPVLYFYCSLMTFRGDINKTAALLMGEPPSDFSLKVSKLKKLFPKAKDHQVRDVLIASIGDMDEASKRLESGLASVEATAQITIPPEDSATTNPTKASPPSATSTSTTTTSHVKGAVQSFTITTKTHTASVLKPKPASKPKAVSKSTIIDLTKESEDEALADSPLKQYPSSSPSPIKNEEQGTVGSPIIVQSLDEKVAQLLEFLPKANRDICEDMLQVCDGDVQSAYNILANDITTPFPEQVGANEANSREGQEQNDGTLVKEESSDEKIAKLREVFPKASLVACENALTACNGNANKASNLLESQYTPVRCLGRLPSSLTISTKTNSTSKSAHRGETNDPSSQRSNLDNIANFFASKLSASPIINEKEVKEADPFEEVSEDKIEQLFETLLRKVSRNACRKALEMNDGDELAAYETLSAEHGIWDEEEEEGIFGRRRLCKRDGTLAASPREARERRRERASTAELSASRQKRKAESPIARASKIARVLDVNDEGEYDADADGDDDEEDKEVVQVNLAPAPEWIKKMYPEPSGVVVLLGSDRVPRDNIPCKVLKENFDMLKLHIDGALSRNTGPSKIEIKMPYVSPEAFDLVAQFMICGDISLEAGPNEEHIASILELIDAADRLGVPRLDALINRMTFKLRAILVRDHLALRGSHIRAAYDLKDEGGPIQELFVLASVRRILQYKDDDSDSQFEDDEDEDMSAAQQASYSGSGFVFNREMKRIPQFERALWKLTLKCLAKRDRSIRRAQRGSTTEISVPVFLDPLNNKLFEL